MLKSYMRDRYNQYGCHKIFKVSLIIFVTFFIKFYIFFIKLMKKKSTCYILYKLHFQHL